MSRKRKIRGLTRIVVEDAVIPKIKQFDENFIEFIEVKKEGLKKNIRCIYCNSKIDRDVFWNGSEHFICTNNNPNECRGHTGKLSQRWSIYEYLPLSWYRKDSDWYKEMIKEVQKKDVPFREKRIKNNAINVAGVIFLFLLFFWLFTA